MTTATMTWNRSSTNGFVYFSGFGDTATALSTALHETVEHIHKPITRTTTKSKFKNLALTWKIDTRIESNPTVIAQHPAYRQIIGMGKEALPLIIKDLEGSPNHWFIALQSIVGSTPVKPQNRGDMDSMARDWVEWYESKDAFLYK